MAGLQEVIDALVAEVRSAIAPLSYSAIAYAGWPTQANLQELVAKNIQSHVSVYPLPGERNTTRFAREVATAQAPIVTLTAIVLAGQIVIAGSTVADQVLTITIDQAPPIACVVPAGTSLANAAAIVANAINLATLPGVTATASGSTVAIAANPSPQVQAVVRGSGTLTKLLRQQEKHFMVTVWAPTPDIREALAEAIDDRLGTMDRLPLSDFPGRIRYQSTYEEEPQERLQVFRRSLTYSVEWARTATIPATQIMAARVTFEP